MQCMPRVRLLLLCQTFTSSYLHSHQKQGWVDFNTVNHHCTVGMDFHKFRSSALAILPKSRITDLPNVSQIKIRIQEYCLAKPPPANKVRFGRLLLVLPAINKFRWNFRILREKKQKRSDQVLLFGIQLSIINQPAEPGELVLQANPWQHRCRPSYSRPLSGEIIWSTFATLEKPSKLNLINWFFSILESLWPLVHGTYHHLFPEIIGKA